MAKSSDKTLRLVQVSLLAALVLLLAFTPGLGYIPLGITSATIIHVPVIIGSLILGPIPGAILGFLFGLTSMIQATLNPGVTSFLFSPFYAASMSPIAPLFSIIIAFVPRILVGIVPYYVYQLIRKLMKNRKGSDSVGLLIGGIAGSMTNTILVLGFIYLLFGEAYAGVYGVGIDKLFFIIMSVVGINGSLEAVVAAILTAAIGKALKAVFRHR